MSRTSAVVLLVVFGIGVFMTGLELMITAVALPAIILDFTSDTVFAFSELRKASWIINGYLLAYVVSMPLAGRLADLWGTRRLFLGALVIFIVGSALAGRAQSLDELIAARIIQAVGGGVLVPVGTAAASHLFSGHARPRALGVIGALTFLGMAAGPFLGAAILTSLHVDVALGRLGIEEGLLVDWLAPAWRWVFYVNVPIGLVALVVGWAASHGWDTPSRRGPIDLLGAITFTTALGAGLIAVTLVGVRAADLGLDPGTVIGGLIALAVVATVVTIIRGFRQADPYLDPRLFRSRVFTSATLVSLLTGYAFATAIIGGAVFVDRVLYGGPDVQRLALGSLAGATAVGALVSGFAVRILPLALVTIGGLGASATALALMAGWGPATQPSELAILLGVFGLGFGLTVTPRSTAAVEFGRQPRLRSRLGDRHRRPDAGHGRRPGDPDGLRLDHDRPPLRPGVRHPGVVQGLHSRRAARPSLPRSVRRRGPRGLGGGRGRPDHVRHLPRRGRRDPRGHPRGAGDERAEAYDGRRRRVGARGSGGGEG